MNRSSVASHLRVEVKHRCAAPKRYTWEIFSEGKTLRVEVKHRCAAPKRYTWEIFSEGKTLPVEESTDRFRSWEEASQAGKKALEEIISKSCREAFD